MKIKSILLATSILLSNTAEAKIVHYDNINGFTKVQDFYKRYDKQAQPLVQISPLTGVDMLHAINKQINERVKYKSEPKGFDYWQTPIETVTLQTGDCEDFALMKWYALLQHGIPERDMTILQGFSGGEMHAILQVYYNKQFYYLDNNSNDITINNVRPLGSYNINRFGVNFWVDDTLINKGENNDK